RVGCIEGPSTIIGEKKNFLTINAISKAATIIFIQSIHSFDFLSLIRFHLIPFASTTNIIILSRHYHRFENNRLNLRKNPSCCSKDCNGTDSPKILLAILRYAIDALLSGVNATGAPEFAALITSSLSKTIPTKSIDSN